MQISDILSPSLVFCGHDGGSKKRLLQAAAAKFSEHLPELAEQQIADGLLARERLGSTGVGSGVAIPHCRMEACQEAVGALFQLNEGIGFDAPDGRPVKLVFVLLVPAEATSEHLQILGTLAQAFSETEYRIALIEAQDPQQLYRAATSFDAGAVAATGS